MNAKSEEKRDLILDAALRVFGQRGFSQTRLSDVAEDAGIAKGTVYLYFSSKEELFREMAIRQFAHFESHAKQILEDETSSFAQAMNALSRFHLMSSLHPQSSRLWELSRFEHDQELNAELQLFLSNYTTLVKQRMEIESCQQAHLSAMAFVGVNESFKMEAMMRGDEIELESFISERASYVSELMEIHRKKTSK